MRLQKISVCDLSCSDSNTRRSEGQDEDDGGGNDRDAYRDMLVTSLLIMACFFLLIVSARLGADIMYSGKERTTPGDNNSSCSGSGAPSHPAGQHPQCPPSWIAVQGKCYFFSEEKTTQEESINKCAESGSTLATVREREETLQRLIRITGQKFWIGLINTGVKIPGKWEGKWTDGSTVVIETDGVWSCAVMGRILSLENCYTEHRWICERNTAE
uniref:C-type lectin domain-containing protein n=1 Tax=Leptobrachium leishanense TaxID=445787 RepID=A0A8C5LL46_9ANUR